MPLVPKALSHMFVENYLPHHNLSIPHSQGIKSTASALCHIEALIRSNNLHFIKFLTPLFGCSREINISPIMCHISQFIRTNIHTPRHQRENRKESSFFFLFSLFLSFFFFFHPQPSFSSCSRKQEKLSFKVEVKRFSFRKEMAKSMRMRIAISIQGTFAQAIRKVM